MYAQELQDNLIKNREAIYRELINVSRQKVTTTYTDLFGKYGADMGDPSHRNEAARCLGEISTQEYHAGRPLLSVVVVHANDGDVGDGFFTLADELGFPINARSPKNRKDEFFIEQLKKTHECWAKNKDQS